MFQNHTVTDTNKKAHVCFAITYYLFFTSVQEKTTFFDSSLLPDTPKTTLIIFSMCIILYNLACIFIFTILFSIINDHNYWVKWLVGTLSYSTPFHRWEIKLWKLDYKRECGFKVVDPGLRTMCSFCYIMSQQTFSVKD